MLFGEVLAVKSNRFLALWVGFCLLFASCKWLFQNVFGRQLPLLDFAILQNISPVIAIGLLMVFVLGKEGWVASILLALIGIDLWGFQLVQLKTIHNNGLQVSHWLGLSVSGFVGIAIGIVFGVWLGVKSGIWRKYWFGLAMYTWPLIWMGIYWAFWLLFPYLDPVVVVAQIGAGLGFWPGIIVGILFGRTVIFEKESDGSPAKDLLLDRQNEYYSHLYEADLIRQSQGMSWWSREAKLLKDIFSVLRGELCEHLR
jgi:hypothetical protein